MQGAASFVNYATTSLPIATFFLSMAVGVVAWLQWRVARNKLWLDLFDRRYKVFEATRKFLWLIYKNVNYEKSELTAFNLATSDAEFLFGHDVVHWLATIQDRAAELSTTRTLLSQATKDDAELARLREAEKQHILWVLIQINDMTTVFSPYLGFKCVK